MEIVKLKAKNQVTIPADIVKQMHLYIEELFAIEVEDNYIKLIPVEVEPRYTKEELNKINKLVDKEKSKAKSLKSGKELNDYIESL